VTEALKQVNFHCPQGKISCLLGPNGAGKTSIIKILSGLILPDYGDAEILGVSLSEAPTGFKTRIGLVTPNERSFYWRLTGLQNLNFFAALYGLKGKERKKRVSEVLEVVGLADEADKPFRLYSAGMKQKLLLARALLGNPEILLLDEPTTHLDPPTQRAMHSLIREKLVNARKTTILLCTHNLAEAQELSDHLIFLNEGNVLAEGSFASLRRKLATRSRVVLELARLPKKSWKNGLPIELLSEDKHKIELKIFHDKIMPAVIESIVAKGGKLLSCKRYEESLPDIFARITGGGV
jgi:ABC-2 type transport system ATP-binding protein